MTCEIRVPCTTGRDLRLCVHPGGHAIPDGWADYALGWAEAVSAP